MKPLEWDVTNLMRRNRVISRETARRARGQALSLRVPELAVNR